MPTTVTRQTSFASGLWSDTLHERTDLKGYLNALAECRNFIVTKHGALTNRPGTKFVGEVKDNTKKVRLIPFHFGSGQSFVLEFGDLYVRFYQNGGRVLSGGVPYEIVSPYAYTDLPRLKYVQSGDVITLVHPSYPPHELKRLGNTNWTLTAVSYDLPPAPWTRIHVQGWGAATGKKYQYGLTAVYADGRESLPRITSACDPTADFEITFGVGAAAGREMPMSYRLYKGNNGILGLYAEFISSDLTQDAFAVGPVVGAAITFHDTGQYVIDYNTNPPKGFHPWHGQPAAWQIRTHYWAGEQVTANGNVYEAINAGMSADSGAGPAGTGVQPDGVPARKPVWGYLAGDLVTFLGVRWVCTVPGNTGADGNLISGPNTTAWDPAVGMGGYRDGTVAWAAATGWSETRGEDVIQWKCIGPAAGATVRYPAANTLYEQRTWVGDTTDGPGKLMGSAVGDSHNFDPPDTVLDASPITGLTLASLKYEEIRWLLPMRVLLAGTSEAVWPITGAQGSGTAITATSRKARPEVFRGVSWLDPLIAGEAALVVADLDSAVYELTFDFRLDSYQGSEISILADSLFDGMTLTAWAYAPRPYGVAWGVRSDGALVGLTYLREQQIAAWHWHDTQGLFESVCVVKEGNEYATYVEVQRTKGDLSTHRYVERFASRVLPRVNKMVDTRKGLFLDCALSYDAAPATVFSGLDHLEGLDVTVLADGNVAGPYRVTAGAIDISAAFPDGASIVHAGLPYTSEGESLNFAMQGTETSEKLKRVMRVGIKVVDTRGGSFGATLDRLVEWRQRAVKDSYGNVPAYTGSKKVLVSSAFDGEGRVAFRQPYPLPMTIIGLAREVELGD